VKPHVVLLAVTDDDPLAARLTGELEALGLDVTRKQIDPTLHIEEMVRVALAGGARGVVVADGRRTEFWVAEEGSDRIAMRQELETEVSPTMESVLSLRTVEFLRVSLGLAGHAVAPPPVERPPPPKPEETDQRVAFSLHAGAVGSTGELSPFATVGAAFRARVAGPVALELRGLAPLGSQELRGPGPIDTTVWLAGGGLVLAPRTAARVGFDVGAGALAAVVRAAGTANLAFTGHVDYAIGVAVYGRVACRVRLSPSWALRVDFLGGTTAPQRPIVAARRGGDDVATWGLGFVSGLAGIEAAF
jgi:hypothetical protein